MKINVSGNRDNEDNHKILNIVFLSFDAINLSLKDYYCIMKIIDNFIEEYKNN